MNDNLTLSGRARRLGDNVCCDLVLPPRRRRETVDPVAAEWPGVRRGLQERLGRD